MGPPYYWVSLCLNIVSPQLHLCEGSYGFPYSPTQPERFVLLVVEAFVCCRG